MSDMISPNLETDQAKQPEPMISMANEINESSPNNMGAFDFVDDPAGSAGVNSGIHPHSNLQQSNIQQSPQNQQQQQNLQQMQQPQKSHLAEILGSHEMNQLKTMSRSSTDFGPTGGHPQNMPQNMNRPNNPGMMSHQMGGYERFQSPGFNHMQHPAFMNTVPPGTQPQMNPNFRFNTPNPVRNVNPNFGGPGNPHPGSHPSPHDNSPSMSSTPAEAKPSGKRPRRPSRKNSRDGDDAEGPRRKRKSNKDEPGATNTNKGGRKRKPKNATNSLIPEGQLYMFSTQMLNDASDHVIKKKQSTMVSYHQTQHGVQPCRITSKNAPPNPTTPPIPSGTLGQNLPGIRTNHRQSPGMMSNQMDSQMNAMSPISNVMSPGQMGGPRNMIPGRVPTPHDGRLTPGSISGHRPMGSNMTPNLMTPLSPAHSQDSRIPTPNSHSPATAPSPSPSATPLTVQNNNQITNQSQEEKINKIQEIRDKMLAHPGNPRNPTPPGMSTMTMENLRQSEKRHNSPMNPPSQGTPENPSPGPQNHPQQMNQTPEQIEMIKLIQQRQAKQQMLIQNGYSRHPYPPHNMPHMGHRSMMMVPGAYPGMRPTMRYPGMGDFPGHPQMGPMRHPMQYHPGMAGGMGPRMGPMGHPGMQSRFPQGQDPRIRPGMNQNFSFSEQLRQQALQYSNHSRMPQSDMSFGPRGGARFGGPTASGQGQNMMSQDGAPNGPSYGGPGQAPHGQSPHGQSPHGQSPHGQGPHSQSPHGQGPPGQENGYIGGSYPSSYSPSSQMHQNAQNGPGGMMSPISNSMGGHPHGPMSNGPTNGLHADSPYPNQARSPAGSQNMNGPNTSPSPSQGRPSSIGPPELPPTTPQGGAPLSPACTNPMTPVSHAGGGPHTPGGGPVTPGDPHFIGNPGSNAPPLNTPMTPLTNPMTPGGNPVTPGPATPGGNQLGELEAPLSNHNMHPCSPMTHPAQSPQVIQNMGNSSYPNRPDQPLTPSTPNGPGNPQMANGPHGKMSDIVPQGLDISSIISADQSMGGNGPTHTMQNIHPGQNYGYGPRMSHPGMHPSGHPGMGSMGPMGNRMGMGMHQQQMGMMANQMSHHPSYAGQWGGYPSGPRY